ncbi:MAG: hypothetical protein ACLFP1_07775, partial [Candidatus Goldiibacteriota bacterium]
HTVIYVSLRTLSYPIELSFTHISCFKRQLILQSILPLLNPLQEYVTGKKPPVTYSILPRRDGQGKQHKKKSDFSRHINSSRI